MRKSLICPYVPMVPEVRNSKELSHFPRVSEYRDDRDTGTSGWPETPPPRSRSTSRGRANPSTAPWDAARPLSAPAPLVQPHRARSRGKRHQRIAQAIQW
jgi:hypothetical protein